jgi:type IX secretion system substrate protein
MKKLYRLSILTLSLSLSLSLVKADWWTQKADFPGFKRVLPISFSIGTTGYIGWGTDTTNMSVKDLWAYNQSSNSWTQKATLPGAARSGAACFANPVSGKAYAGTGQNTLGTLFQDWWEYNPVANQWTAKANFAGGQRALAVGFYAGFYGYVGCGNGPSGDMSDLWLYDPVGNQWLAKAPIPSFGRKQAATFTIGTKGYVVTGYNSSATTCLLDNWEYDALGDVWNLKNSFFGDPRYGAAAFSLYGKGYLLTGELYNNNVSADNWQYDTITDAWYPKTNFIGAARKEAAYFSIGIHGYIGCGGSPGSFYKNFWEYTPDTSTGINEVYGQELQFSVYPNPAKSFIIVSPEPGANEDIVFTIADVQGKKVYFQKSEAQNKKREIEINVGKFPPGIYFITADNGKQKAVKKFLKE